MVECNKCGCGGISEGSGEGSEGRPGKHHDKSAFGTSDGGDDDDDIGGRRLSSNDYCE